MKLRPNSRRLLSLLWLTSALPAMSTTFTYSTLSGTATENWSAGTGWSGVPVSANDTTLTFEALNTDVFATGSAIISNNDTASPPFQLNVLNLQGTGPASGSAALATQGGALQLAGAGATVNLNAIKGAGLTYNINNNLALAGNTLFTGGGTAAFNFQGTLSGTGSLTKTGGSTLSLGNLTASNGLNDDYLYSGDINANAGKLAVNFNGNVYTKSKLTISSGATVDLVGHAAVSSLFGTAGTLTSTSPGGFGRIYIAYTGSDAAAGFTGTISGATGLIGAGSGNLTFGTLTGKATLQNAGTGMMTADAMTGTGDGAAVYTPFSQIKLTGSSGAVNSASGVTRLSGGTLTLAPPGSGANVLVTGQGLSGTYRVRIAGGGTLRLDKGANTSMEYRVGLGTNTNSDFLAFVSGGNAPGTLILDPVGGAASLGSNTGARFTILNSTSGKILTNGLANTSLVVVDNDSTRKADFVTYNGTGVAGDAGYQQATYTLTDTFAGSSNTSSVKNTVAQTISANTSAFALRNDSAISIDAGVSLTLGAPNATANANADATTSPHTGLILNGGTISGAGTLALGATEATVYTSGAGGTISAGITGSGGTNSGYGTYSGATPVSLTKFGAGTLTLSGANTYTGATVINAGAVDVGAITASGGLSHKLSGSSGNLTFGGGVLQGNGTFARPLGLGGNAVTWNGINGTNSQMSGGFAAQGGDLVVAIGGTASPTALVWGLTNGYNVNFITENTTNNAQSTGVLMFGSDTSTGQVDFQNAIDLGTLASTIYYRTIHVAQGTGTDSAKLSGVISSTVVHGLIKDGPGKLILAAANTYTGDTAVAAGTLEITGSNATTGNITVNTGATLSLAGTGSLGFAITNNEASSITGTGTATFDGAFTLNTAAVTNTTGSWTLVNATSKTFGSSFTVTGFTQKPDGVTWTVIEEGTRLWTFSETTGVLTLSVAPTNTFSTWIDGYFTGVTDPAIIGATADPDNDGIPNGVEYVIGNLPNQTKVENLPTSGFVTANLGDGSVNYLKFSYRRTTASVDAGVVASVQYNTGLAGTWTTAVDTVAGVHIVETPNAGLPGTDVDVYIPRGANATLFGRLSVEVP